MRHPRSVRDHSRERQGRRIALAEANGAAAPGCEKRQSDLRRSASGKVGVTSSNRLRVTAEADSAGRCACIVPFVDAKMACGCGYVKESMYHACSDRARGLRLPPKRRFACFRTPSGARSGRSAARRTSPPCTPRKPGRNAVVHSRLPSAALSAPSACKAAAVQRASRRTARGAAAAPSAARRAYDPHRHGHQGCGSDRPRRIILPGRLHAYNSQAVK